MKKLPKLEAKKQISEFFFNIKDKSPKEIKKIKGLAMGNNIPLREQRKKFCKKCLTPYSGEEKIRIKKGKKVIVCKKCGYVSRWRIK